MTSVTTAGANGEDDDPPRAARPGAGEDPDFRQQDEHDRVLHHQAEGEEEQHARRSSSPPRPERQASRTIIAGLCEQELADVEVAALEPEPCGRHVQPPRSRDFLAGRGHRRIPVRLEPRDSCGERQRVVRTKRLDPSCHSSSSSARIIPTRRMMASRLGKIPTTAVRRLKLSCQVPACRASRSMVR